MDPILTPALGRELPPEPDVDFASLSEEVARGLAIQPETGKTFLTSMPEEEFDPQYKDDVDGLLWLGYLTRSCPLYGHHFILKSLTRGERLAVTLVAQEYSETVGLGMAMESATVSASLLTKNGVPFHPKLSETQDPIIRIREAFQEVNSWYDPLIEALFTQYKFLNLRVAQAFAELEGK